jgi:hypothetical protein
MHSKGFPDRNNSLPSSPGFLEKATAGLGAVDSPVHADRDMPARSVEETSKREV